ncbi:E3 ubiquitin-protein ligase RBBP6 isoform X2 [Nematolebias whitei]|uniref:E3 ubiquitin-protein ligase RBBP6 isoform X2 n=1 Tax=Nematolebias whitei TaxID=451745 RepID=UPI001898C8AB|nr:E3 ubiquitin-protein ligase RBBP6 isoform X2 [Nematolebias whitei]
MSCVHYKFSSKLDYNTVTFDGLHITLSELKRQIMARERLKATDCDLQITNAQTREEYTDDDAHIPKHSSVIVRRTPIGGVKPAGRTFIVDRSDSAVVGSSRPTDSSPSLTLAQLAKTPNLVDANASEEDKIKAMMSQSNHEYDPIHYSKKATGPPPAHYLCYRCEKSGHHIRNCPALAQDKSAEAPKQVKTSKGIPQSFMVKVEPGAKGAMLTNTGEYAIPAIDAEAYAQGKKERPPFVPHEQSSSEDDSDPIPDELLCPICNDLMTDAVVIPCCGNSYCDDCIRTFLLDSEEHICFTCKQSDVSPDNLIANKFLRQAVNNFKNETGYTKRGRKQVQPAAPPPPRPQLFRPLHSRQQDPLLANVSHPPSTSVPTTAPKSEVPPLAPSTAAAATPPAPATPSPPHAAAVEEGEASPTPELVDSHSPELSNSQDEPPPLEEAEPEPAMTREDSSGPSKSTSQSYSLPVISHLPPARHSSGQQSRPSQSHRGGGNRHWYRNRGEQPPSHLQTALPPAPAPQVYPAPLYPAPPQPYPPPYSSGPGLIPPPAISFQPQPVYAPGPPGLNPPWIAPGAPPSLVPLPAPLLPPHLSKDDFYRPRHHRQDKVTSKLDEFTKDFHEELMKYRNASKRRRRSYSRSRSFSRSISRSPYSRSRSRSRSYSFSPSRSRSRSHGRSYPRSSYSRRNGRSFGRSRTRSRSRSRSYGYRRSGSPRSPLSYRAGGWDGAESARPYRSRSRSRSPGGYRSRSPGGRKPPPRELLPYDLKGASPGSHDRWERERYRQMEKEYTDWYNNYYKDYDGKHPVLHHRGRSRERDKMSSSSRDYSPQGKGKRGKKERDGAPHHLPSSAASGTKSSSKILKSKKIKKKKAREEPQASQQSLDTGDVTPVRDEPMDELSPNKTPPVSSRHSGGTQAPKASASKGTAAPAKPTTKLTSKAQLDKTKKEKGLKVKAKLKTEAVKVKSDKLKKKTGEAVLTKKKDSSMSSSVTKSLKTVKTKPDDTSNSTTPKKDKSKSSTMRPALIKPPSASSHNLPPPHPFHDGPRSSHDIQGRRDFSKGDGHLPPLNRLLPRPPSPIDSWRRIGEECRPLLGPPPEKLRRLDGLDGGGDAPFYMHLHQPPLRRLPHPADRPFLSFPGPHELGRGEIDRGAIRPLDIQKPLRKIKLNRDLGRRRSIERAPSDRTQSGPEKTTTSEGAVRKERSASAERGISRERPGSAGDRCHGSNREQDRERDRPSGSDKGRERDKVSDRERDKVSDRERDKVSDRERDKVSDRERDKVSDRERDKVSDREKDKVSDREKEKVSDREKDKVSVSGSQKASVSKGTESKKLIKTEQNKSTGGSGGGRSVSVDKMTIGEKSAITRKLTDHEKPSVSSKESGDGSERVTTHDRSTSKDRTAKSALSGEKPAAAQKEAKDGQETTVKRKPRISRKALTSHAAISKSTKEKRQDSEKDKKNVSSNPPEQPQSSPVSSSNRSPSASPAREEPLIQPPPRSKWEREDDEEGLEDGFAAPVLQKSRGREGQLEVPKSVKSEVRDASREEKKGSTREEKKEKAVKEEGKGSRSSHTDLDKPPKSKVVREEERRTLGKDDDKRGGREESRNPEPRKQRLCSDLTRETDEAAFVPDYSEGEGSELERGKSGSPSESVVQPSLSPSASNLSSSVPTAEKKKKHKRHKKGKKHKKHSSQDKGGSRHHKHKSKKKKLKKSKDKDVEEDKKKGKKGRKGSI